MERWLRINGSSGGPNLFFEQLSMLFNDSSLSFTDIQLFFWLFYSFTHSQPHPMNYDLTFISGEKCCWADASEYKIEDKLLF